MNINIFFIACSLLSIVLFIGNFIIKDWKSIVSLIPVNVFVSHYYTWNLITSNFYEDNLLKLIISIGILFQITRKINIDNFETFGIYFIVVTLACTIFSTAYCFTRFFGTAIDEMITSPTFGLSGIIISLSLYARQQLKNETVLIALSRIFWSATKACSVKQTVN